jgi:hypothetical protein
MSEAANGGLSGEARVVLDDYAATARMPRAVEDEVWRRIARSRAARAAPRAAPAATASTSARTWAIAGLVAAAAIVALWWGGVLTPSAATRGDGHGARTQAGDETKIDRAEGQADTRGSAGARREHAGEHRAADASSAGDEPVATGEAVEIETLSLEPEAAPPTAIEATSVETTTSRTASPATPSSPRGTTKGAPPAEPPTQAPPARTDLFAELDLLARAQSALAKGKPAETRKLVAEHRRSYPRSTLAEERDALDLLAACADGPSSALATKAKAFLERYPGSPQASRIEGSCVP